MFSCYESFESKVSKIRELEETDKMLLLLQYGILFRNWSSVKDKLDELNTIGISVESLKEIKAFIPNLSDDSTKQWDRSTDLSLYDIFKWNADYYVSKHPESSMGKSPDINYYTDIVADGKSIIDMFFCGRFPVLDITQYPCQMEASKRLFEEGNSFHMVFDEVGTGKTVTALYCIRNVLDLKKYDAKILIICPNNKKAEWQSDIRRQLGMYAHVVENGNEKNIYSGACKKLYFHDSEPCIFIEGQKKGQKNEDLDSWESSWDSHEKWNLIIIDEGHLCFNNYGNIKSEKALLLTATPIVINASDEGYSIDRIREFKEYIWLLKNITNKWPNISMENLFAQHSYFSQYFREDLGIETKKRNIQFVKCDRWTERDEYLDVLSDVKGGMTRLLYEQDDEYLIYGIFDKFKNEIESKNYLLPDKPEIENPKYEQLLEILGKKDNSYIIFFNCRWPAQNIYNRLKTDLCREDVVIAFRFGGKDMEIYPKDPNANIDNLFDYLQAKIRDEKRVLFLTTGASGGTGLNLGDFDGVINYELPFTCIELEQRFGRVDRMDKSNSNQKEMFFLINNDYNPMLRYSTIKLHVTATRMPIRNTVLFYPEYIEANNDAFEEELRRILEIKKEVAIDKGLLQTLSDKYNDKYKCFVDVIGKINSQPDKEAADKILHTLEKTKKSDDIEIEEGFEELEGLYHFLERKDTEVIKEIILPCFRIYRNLQVLKGEIKRWSDTISPQNDTGESYEPVSGEIIDDSDEPIFDQDNESWGKDNEFLSGNQLTIEKANSAENSSKSYVERLYSFFSERFIPDCEEIIDMLIKLKNSNGDKVQQASGVFYIEKHNGRYEYHRQTVKELREYQKSKRC